MKPLISIIAPMYNEEGLVGEYCKETLAMAQGLEAYDFEIILVNDGSKDNTYSLMLDEQAKDPERISVVCLSRNFGLEGAVSAGLRVASGDAVVVMDADLQDPPSLIPAMVEKWENGADIVVASRAERSHDSAFKKLSAGMYYKIMDLLSGKLRLERNAANFRLLSRKAVDKLLALPETNGVFRVQVPYLGMKTSVVEYDRDKRFAGKTKYSLKNMIPYALDSLTGISVEPLRKTYCFAGLALLLLTGTAIAAFLTENMWRAVWIIVAYMSFALLVIVVMLTVIAQYLAQIALEVKGRPISIIYEVTRCENAKRRGRE